MKKILGKTKFIFVTGGVVSGIGKGILAASIGNILKARGHKVFIQKLDPYLNIDPGVLSPYEHGEVYVTNDGGETDLDLGHYERFTDEKLTRDSNYTSGRIFQNLINKERSGYYKGKTVQIIPHFTNEILEIITDTAKKYNPDFLIVEIGGTVGDMESTAFIRAIAEFGFFNPNITYFIHTTYIPFLETSKDFKTKPTQYSISSLLEMGIKPNMIALRAHNPLPDEICLKISKSNFLKKENIIPMHDVKSVYEIPLYLEKLNVADIILKHFKIKIESPNHKKWEKFIKLIKAPKTKKVQIGMVGKYTEFEDAYKSIKEALFISSIYQGIDLQLKWISAEKITKANAKSKLENVDGIVILPGFGLRGFEGIVQASIYTRENDIPTLGVCLGMQAMTVAQGRLIGYKDATSSEVSKTGTMIFDLIDKTKSKNFLGGTLKLGESIVEFKENSEFKKIYGVSSIGERHRHRYEVNIKYRDLLETGDFSFSGKDKNTGLVETCEVKNKKFYLGTQYHPEFNSTPLNPHPLFTAFLKSC
ncbi:MAG: CTP synthase [Metamycoplasmataceae bacterium]